MNSPRVEWPSAPPKRSRHSRPMDKGERGCASDLRALAPSLSHLPWAPRARAAHARGLMAGRAVQASDRGRADSDMAVKLVDSGATGREVCAPAYFLPCGRARRLGLRTHAYAAAAPASSARAAGCMLIPRFAARPQDVVGARPSTTTALLLRLSPLLARRHGPHRHRRVTAPISSRSPAARLLDRWRSSPWRHSSPRPVGRAAHVPLCDFACVHAV